MIGFQASFRGMDNDSKSIMLYKHMAAEKGIAVLTIDKSCTIHTIDYRKWIYPKIDSERSELIKKSICHLNLNMLYVDSCQNTYFRATFINNKTYVIVRDSSCLDKRFNYTLFNGDCYVKS